jgi:hypothetical protein
MLTTAQAPRMAPNFSTRPLQVGELDTVRREALSLHRSAAEAAELRAQIERMDQAFFGEVAKAVALHARRDDTAAPAVASHPQAEQCVALLQRLREWSDEYTEYSDDSGAQALGDAEPAAACELAASVVDRLFRVSAERRVHARAHESELRALREQLMATTKQCAKDCRLMAAECERAKAHLRAHIGRLSADVVSEAEESEHLTRQLEIADARARDACVLVEDAHALKLHKMRQAAEADAAVASLTAQLREMTHALGVARLEATALKARGEASACARCEQLLRDEQQSGASTGSPAAVTPARSPTRERLTSEAFGFAENEGMLPPSPPPAPPAQELLDLKRLKMKLQRAAAQVGGASDPRAVPIRHAFPALASASALVGRRRPEDARRAVRRVGRAEALAVSGAKRSAKEAFGCCTCTDWGFVRSDRSSSTRSR